MQEIASGPVTEEQSMQVKFQRNPDGTFHQITINLRNRDDIALMRLVLHRATNCWDVAPAEMKELTDCLMYGKPLQDYAHQEGMLGRSKVELPAWCYEGL